MRYCWLLLASAVSRSGPCSTRVAPVPTHETLEILGFIEAADVSKRFAMGGLSVQCATTPLPQVNARTLCGLMALNCAGRLLLLSLVFSTPAFANMVLLSESRSVTVSYYGSGVGTEVSDGTFGLFEASAVGVPFGGGFMVAYQKSNITPTEITIEHYLDDYYGPGGYALSSFELIFSLLQDTRLTMSGYCSNYSGFVSLTSDSLGEIPVVWNDGPGGDPYGFGYRNFLDFDDVLAAGIYTLASFETPRDAVWTTITIRASSVPEGGSPAGILVIAIATLAAARWCWRKPEAGR